MSPNNRERTITVGFYLLLLIVVTGVSMLLLIVLGGSAVRRSARAPLPRQTPTDPLWFLRDKQRLAERPTETGHESKTNSQNSGQRETGRGEFDSDRPES